MARFAVDRGAETGHRGGVAKMETVAVTTIGVGVIEMEEEKVGQRVQIPLPLMLELDERGVVTC
jgi:hypothetical protein